MEETVGQLLLEARAAKGLTREDLARELKLPLRHIEAMEADDWESMPPGRPRPLARQLAERLGVDLESHAEAFQSLPGKREPEPLDPRQEMLEHIVMGVLTAASVLVLLWLIVPGPRLGRKTTTGNPAMMPRLFLPPPPPPSTAAYPVLGEMLPEAPLNEQGILVSLRGMDACEARIEPSPGSDAQAIRRTLRVSEPWKLRVKGPFTLFLDNAGVVHVEVAGVRILHHQNVGQAWSGQFDQQGHWLRPEPPALPDDPVDPDDDEENGMKP